MDLSEFESDSFMEGETGVAIAKKQNKTKPKTEFPSEANNKNTFIIIYHWLLIVIPDILLNILHVISFSPQNNYRKEVL